jgi:phospholipid N-methyltransferase
MESSGVGIRTQITRYPLSTTIYLCGPRLWSSDSLTTASQSRSKMQMEIQMQMLQTSYGTSVLRRLLRSRGSREASRSSLSQMTHFSDLLSSTPRNPNTISSHALEPQHVAASRCHQVHIVMNATPAHPSFWKFHNTN